MAVASAIVIAMFQSLRAAKWRGSGWRLAFTLVSVLETLTMSEPDAGEVVDERWATVVLAAALAAVFVLWRARRRGSRRDRGR
ncbi:MAG: hypothetical protein JOZ04_06095 [Acidimicrobiia bacterium]|nr:hypothetical protein [Acidimicrobiia bacterium]